MTGSVNSAISYLSTLNDIIMFIFVICFIKCINSITLYTFNFISKWKTGFRCWCFLYVFYRICGTNWRNRLDCCRFGTCEHAGKLPLLLKRSKFCALLKSFLILFPCINNIIARFTCRILVFDELLKQ